MAKWLAPPDRKLWHLYTVESNPIALKALERVELTCVFVNTDRTELMKNGPSCVPRKDIKSNVAWTGHMLGVFPAKMLIVTGVLDVLEVLSVKCSAVTL